MTRVAIISNPIRSKECSTYLDSNVYEGPNVILCPYKNIFRQVEIPKSSSILVYRNRASIFLSKQRVLATLNYQMKHTLRSSLVVGLTLEKIYKFFIPKIRRFAISKSLKRAKARESRSSPETNEHLLSALTSVHQKGPIVKIVVFEISELPTILKFVESLDIEVLIQ